MILFVENCNGEPIDGNWAAEICKESWSLFALFSDAGIAPMTWSRQAYLQLIATNTRCTDASLSYGFVRKTGRQIRLQLTSILPGTIITSKARILLSNRKQKWLISEKLD